MTDAGRDRRRRRFPAMTRAIVAGRISVVGGASRYCTFRNRSVSTVSFSAAVSTRSMYALTSRTGSDRCPSTCGIDRSLPLAICQATSSGFATALKNRCASRAWPPGSAFRRVIAWIAATVMPWA
ncbi:MAG: hypothetical protein LC808_02680 [Actinobacteria bacterium]|nr:hypothetical protein [Actinomycetota bacterium]